MKKLIFLLSTVYLLALSNKLNAQCLTDATVVGTVQQYYDPANKIAGKTTGFGANVPFTRLLDPHSTWISAHSSDIDICLHIAMQAWSNALASPDPSGQYKIRIYLTSASRGWNPSGSNTLAGTVPCVINTTPTTEIFPQALYNYLYCENYSYHGDNQNDAPPSGSGVYPSFETPPSGNFDMAISLNEDVPWFYNTTGSLSCPSSQMDLVTVLTHEIAHGLGFVSSADFTGSAVTTNYWENHGYSSSYGTLLTPFDYNIGDAATGGTCSPNTALYTLSSGSTNLTNYCEGLGNYDGTCSNSSNTLYVFCTTPVGGSVLVQLFTPNTFQVGTSLVHTNETLPPSTTTNNELMQPQTYLGTQLSIGPDELNILWNLGYHISPTVGTGAYITINASDCSSAPNQLFSSGCTNSYCANSGGMGAPGSLSLMLYDENANPITILTGSGGPWSVSYSSIVSAMPSGTRWMRDADGNIAGIISVTASGLSDAISIGVEYAPQELTAGISNVSSYYCYCDQTQVSFYDPGATSYLISHAIQLSSGLWHWFPSVTVPSSQTSYTFSSLSQANNYEFQVQAVNSYGSSALSNLMVRNRCQSVIKINPNPTSLSGGQTTLSVVINPSTGTGMDGDDGSYTDGVANGLGFDNNAYNYDNPSLINPCDQGATIQFLLTGVTLVNVANPNTTYNYNLDGSSNSGQIDVSSVQPGIYTLTAVSNGSGESVSTQVEIDN